VEVVVYVNTTNRKKCAENVVGVPIVFTINLNLDVKYVMEVIIVYTIFVKLDVNNVEVLNFVDLVHYS
jgi:predicted metallopeptidase